MVQRGDVLRDSKHLEIVSREGRCLEIAFGVLVWSMAIATAALLFWISWTVYQDARPAVEEFGAGFLWDAQWDVPELRFGALPFIYGTLVSSLLAVLLAVPLGVSVAVVTSEKLLPSWARSLLAFLVELIAAIPSVIIGLWGIFVLIPFLQPIQQFLHARFGWLPLFSTEPFGSSMLAAGVVLAIMILPIVAAIAREVLLAIPQELRSASAALGATRWETIWHVLLPAAVSGILGATVLALGRALGETMAVTMVVGNSRNISVSLLAAGNTIPAMLANQFPEALAPLHVGALMYLALILFAVTLAVNVAANLLVRFIGKHAALQSSH